MDLFTHAVVPYAAARALGLPLKYRIAAALGGIAPDVDVLFAWIPLLHPELYTFGHRGAWHSLAFGGAAVVVVMGFLSLPPVLRLARRFSKVELPIALTPRTFAVGYLAMISHLVLDALTTDGPAALWPADVRPVSLDLFYYTDALTTVWSLAIWIVLFFHRWPRFPRRVLLAGFLALLLILGGARVLFHEAARAQLPEGRLYPDIQMGLWWNLEERDGMYVVTLQDSGSGRTLSVATYAVRAVLGPPGTGIGADAAIGAVLGSAEGRAFVWRLPAYGVIAVGNASSGTWSVLLTDVLGDAQIGDLRGLVPTTASYLVDASGLVRRADR